MASSEEKRREEPPVKKVDLTPQRMDLHSESQCCLDHNAWRREMPAGLKGIVPKEEWADFVDEMNELESHVCNPNWGILMTFCIVCLPYALWRMPKVNDTIADLQNQCLGRWHDRWKKAHNLPSFLFYRHDATVRTIVLDIPSRVGVRPKRRRRSLLDRHRAASARRNSQSQKSDRSLSAATSTTSLRPPRLRSPPSDTNTLEPHPEGTPNPPSASERTSPAGSQNHSFPPIKSETLPKLRNPQIGARPANKDHLEKCGSGEIRPLRTPDDATELIWVD